MTPNSVDKREDSNMKTDPRIVSEHKFSSQTYNKERVLIPNFLVGDVKLLDDKVKSLMETSGNLDPSERLKAKVCKVCGKEGQIMTIRDHIEANHLEGVSLPCDHCGKLFRWGIS